MATRASLTIVNKIVRRNLSVNDAANSDNLATNARFNQSALDDAIASADIKVVNLLKIYKKESLLSHMWTGGGVGDASYASGDSIPANWAIVSVEYTDGGNTFKSIEISWDKFLLLTKYGNKSIFNSNFNSGYHSFRDGKIFHNAPVSVKIIRVKELVHPASLTELGSPAGFENAVASFATAQLLMKRMDRPEEAAYYEKVAYSFLQEYGIPESPKQESSDLQ